MILQHTEVLTSRQGHQRPTFGAHDIHETQLQAIRTHRLFTSFNALLNSPNHTTSKSFFISQQLIGKDPEGGGRAEIRGARRTKPTMKILEPNSWTLGEIRNLGQLNRQEEADCCTARRGHYGRVGATNRERLANT